ncbi:MAG: hypothetical protein JXB07_04795 [Anaerolineae bacterium]|nr:hypothetical protein [Anaerolineae bacterium]
MKYLVINVGRTWIRTCSCAILVLILVAVALVPPGSLPYPPESDYSDASISHWPNANFLRASVLQYGEWPLWNPLRMLGQPFAANPLSKVWYPPQWLVLLLPPTLHLNVMLYLHMAWLALGMFAWMHSEGMHPLSALFATFAWGLTPKLVGHLGAGHLDIVYALAWVPWLLWVLGRVVETPSMGWGGLAGGVAAILVLADVRIAFYMLSFAVMYIMATSFAGQRKLSDSFGALTLAVILLLLLTAVQTVPLLALSPYLTRAMLTSLDAATFSLPPHYLLGLLIPDLGGFHERMTYLGLPVIGVAILALTQRKARRQTWLVWCVAICALLWALGEYGPLFLPVVERLPLARWFRIPSRAWFVVVFSLVIVSARGLDRLLESGLSRHGRLVVLALAFAGGVWSVSSLVLPGLPPVLVGTGATIFGTSIGLWLAGGGLVDFCTLPGNYSNRRSRLAGISILLATLILSLLGVDITLVRAHPMADIERPEQVIIDEIEGSCGSTFSPTFELIGPATARAELATLHGVDPFQLRWSAENIAEAAGTELEGYSEIAPPLPPGEIDLATIDLDIELLRMLGVCWIVSEPGVQAEEAQIHAQLPDVTIYRLSDESLAMSQGVYLDISPVTGINTIRSEICVDTDLAHVVVTQAWAPGWLAWVDGKPASIVAQNGLLAVEFDYSSGCHMVEMAYRPPADLIGIGITGMTVLSLAGWMLLRKWKEMLHA